MQNKKLANLIIAGVNKAGTSSLFTYLSYHPEICASRIKETAYFTPIRFERQMSPIDKYAQYFSHCKQQKYLLEASPGYLYGSKDLAAYMRKVLGDIKIIFILRNPIDRLFSYFRHLKSTTLLTPGTNFQEFVELSIKATYKLILPEREENPFVQGLMEGFFIQYLEDWYKVFPKENIKIVFFDLLMRDPVELMQELCVWLDIDHYIYRNIDFTIENRTAYYKLQWLHKLAMGTNRYFERFLRNHYKLKQIIRDLYYSLNEKLITEPLDHQNLTELAKIYFPYNKRLALFLKSNGYHEFPAWLKKYANG